MDWAELINHLLRENKIGIAELSRRSGVNLQSLLNILSGRSEKLRLKGKLGLESAFGIRIAETERGLVIQSPAQPHGQPTKHSNQERDIYITPQMINGFDRQIGDAKSISVIPVTRDDLLQNGLYYIETEIGNFLRIYSETGMEQIGLFRSINPIDEQILFAFDAINIYRVRCLKYE